MIRIMRYGEIPDEKIFFRGEIKTDVAGIVSDILANVKKNGDAALREYADKFDGFSFAFHFSSFHSYL